MSSSALAEHPVDRFVRALSRRVGVIGPTPVTRTLSTLRQAAVERAIGSRRARVDELDAAIDAGEPGARERLADLADAALAELRADVRARAASAGLLQRLAAETDARWADCEEGEYLDDPALDEALRQRIMRDLDSLNGLLDAYEVFLEQLLPLAASGRTTRVLDLAAGHGGFALAAAREARERELDLRFTASDLKREYLDLGAEIAAREQLPVEFRVQDALDLSNLEAGAYDLITCTQSLHHFPPGLVALMFRAAARAAARGVVFLDGCRSALVGVALAGVGLTRFRNPAFAHDAWVSTRRFYVPEELDLLARLGSWGDAVEARWVPPGYCMLRLRA